MLAVDVAGSPVLAAQRWPGTLNYNHILSRILSCGQSPAIAVGAEFQAPRLIPRGVCRRVIVELAPTGC